MAHDPFVGTWQMDPNQNDYERGEPPQSGMYTIEEAGNGYTITMAWVTTAGERREMSYDAIPDGQLYPIGTAPGDMSMTRVDERTLDSTVRVAGEVTNHARRVLSEDGQVMTVVQTAYGETTTVNRSVYRRS